MTHLTMRDLPADDRPTEKLYRLGAGALSDAELIAVVIRSGTRQHSALALAQRLITKLESGPQASALAFIRSASVEEMTRLPGIGRVKALQLKAAAELGLRISRGDRTLEQKKIQSPQDLFPFLQCQLGDLPQEQLLAVLLDTRNRIIRLSPIGSGGLNGAVLYPRDLFREAIRANAASVILVHNHPSGDPEPSKEDIDTSRRLCELGQLMGVRVLDHLIVSRKACTSLKQRGLLP